MKGIAQKSKGLQKETQMPFMELSHWVTCWICGGDHLKKECLKKGKWQGSYAWHYDHCDKDNHNEGHCFQLHSKLWLGQFKPIDTNQGHNGAKNTKGKGVLTKGLIPKMNQG